MNDLFRNIIRTWPLLLLFLLFACKTTKYVPDNRYLLNDIEIKIDNDAISKEELHTHLRQEENLKILGLFKFHLWLYNLSSQKKESGWLKNIGEPPVIYDSGLKNRSKQQLTQYLNNKGYYQAVVEDSVIFSSKKAKVLFQIQSGDPYLIRNISYEIKDQTLLPLIMQNRKESLIREGAVFDVDLLEKERERIALLLRNEGYFKFAEEYIHYRVDTTLFQQKVNVDLIVEKANVNSQAPDTVHQTYHVDRYLVYIDKQRAENGDGQLKDYLDTTHAGGFTFLHNGKLPISQNLLMKSIEIDPGERYSKRKEDKSYNNLYALRQFKFVNIQYQELNEVSDSLGPLLQGRIFLPLQVKQNYSFDIEGTNTSGNLGIAGNINYQHRNLLGGAEIFDITVKGATERQITVIDEQNMEFNTREYGGAVKLTVPGFLFPVREERFNLYSMPFTSISLAYNYQNRPDYTRTIVNSTLAYRWRTSRFTEHSFNLLDLNAVRIFSLNPDFINSIKDLYIKSSYTDHIISASSYSFTFNNQDFNRRPYYHYLRANFEAAGNFLWAYSALTGREKVSTQDPASLDRSEYYQYFDTRFAQYLKSDIDFRYGYRFDKYNAVATRIFGGLAYPYGNFNVIPFEKRYFTGGANGIRAWQVRSLGPGSYGIAAGEYPNQSADVKLEANIEYRYHLFWMIEGAFFVDAGNIWAINQFDNREGALFRFDRFYKEFAVGTGMGLRLVTTYFILRADAGLKLRDPSLPEGARWITANRRFNQRDVNFNIAIGYPF
ncbi:translocation and assembly module lipoprotein TamL [Roseimarinus sediminis]|uniref:translocation and assembly module lipoprotein TamL n=1 Tax=Roseimarinus sediminis TaxID=1610899 RepID=UPI003D192D69